MKADKSKRKFFVCQVRASAVKFFGIVALCLASLLVLIAFIPTYEPTDSVTDSEIVGGDSIAGLSPDHEIKYSKVKTNNDRIEFLSQFGWTVSENAIDEKKVTVPMEFDKALLSYNEFQKKQGLDLTKYKGLEVTRFTYEVTNYPNADGKVFANILVSKNRVIGGDISSNDCGFLHGFIKE